MTISGMPYEFVRPLMKVQDTTYARSIDIVTTMKQTMYLLWICLLWSTIVLGECSIPNTVPAILCSYKLSPGLLAQRQTYDKLATIPANSFLEFAKAMISRRHADAYVFVDIPNLMTSDFIEHRNQMAFIRRRVEDCSTAVAFNNVEFEEDVDFFRLLSDFTSEEWEVQKHITIRGNQTSDFQPYIDTEPRIFRINFEPLPTTALENGRSRAEAINDYDRFLGMILGQLPSPEYTLIIIPSSVHEVPSELGSEELEIFPELLQHPQKLVDYEKNNRVLYDKPQFNQPRQKFSNQMEGYLTIFDPAFLEENYDILRAIVFAIVGFLLLQIVLFWRERAKRTSARKSIAEKKRQ